MEKRIKDIKEKLKLTDVDVLRFRKLSLLGLDVPQLDTDDGVKKVAQILEVQGAIGCPVDLLILDCRYKTVQKSESQDDVMKLWVRKVDELGKLFGHTLLVLHHKGKNTEGVGAGSSVFDRWINTSIELKPHHWDSALKPSKERNVIVGGNYTAGLEIHTILDFPVHVIGGEEVWQKPLSRREEAKNAILDILNGGAMGQEELEKRMEQQGHTRDTFFKAKDELQREKFIFIRQDKTKAGYHNIIDSVLLPEKA
jgi:hypothetical protein